MRTIHAGQISTNAFHTESAIQIQTNAEHRNDDDHDSGSKGQHQPQRGHHPQRGLPAQCEQDGREGCQPMPSLGAESSKRRAPCARKALNRQSSSVPPRESPRRRWSKEKNRKGAGQASDPVMKLDKPPAISFSPASSTRMMVMTHAGRNRKEVDPSDWELRKGSTPTLFTTYAPCMPGRQPTP